MLAILKSVSSTSKKWHALFFLSKRRASGKVPPSLRPSPQLNMMAVIDVALQAKTWPLSHNLIAHYNSLMEMACELAAHGSTASENHHMSSDTVQKEQRVVTTTVDSCRQNCTQDRLQSQHGTSHGRTAAAAQLLGRLQLEQKPSGIGSCITSCTL